MKIQRGDAEIAEISAEKHGMSTIFIISAPSGSGKSTLVSRVMEQEQGLKFSISFTTRKPRGHERVVRERQAAVFMENVYQPRPHQRPPGLWTH